MSMLLYMREFFYGILIAGIVASAIAFALSGRKLTGTEKWKRKIVFFIIGVHITGIVCNTVVAIQWHVLLNLIM